MIKSILGLAALTGVMFLTMDYALSIPNVHINYDSRECVRVDNYPGVVFGQHTFSCEDMPTKFNPVWVVE